MMWTQQAAEFRQGTRPLKFSGALEEEFQGYRLRHSRSLLRATSVMSAVSMLMRGMVLGLHAPPSGIVLVSFGLVFLASAILALIAWSSLFERSYAPWARIVVPFRSAVVPALTVHAAAQGQLEVLMALPVMLVGAFFFFGLRWRVALLSGALVVVAFAVSAPVFHLGFLIVLRSGASLAAIAVACAAGARYFETRARAGFQEQRRMAELAQHDALTGMKNRRVFDEHLVHLWQQAVEDNRGLAVLLVDVDHFKRYNDRYGHLAGDRALRRIAQTVQRLVWRPLDLLARYGGEEFVAILYDMRIDQARDLASRICREVARLGIEHDASDSGRVVTISAGIAAIRPTAGRDPHGAVQLADQALYEAKVRGRNRIHVLEEEDHRAMVTGVFAAPMRELHS